MAAEYPEPADTTVGFAGRELANQLSVDQPRRQLEVLHYPQTDILINNDAELAAHGPQLAEVFINGLPSTWRPHAKYNHISQGEVGGHSFIAKTRRNRPSAANIAALHAGAQEYNSESSSYWNKAEGHAFESLTHEIALSRKIKEVVDTAEIQELAQHKGFKSLHYVEPIAGVIIREPDADRATKLMIYDYIEGEDFESYMHQQPDATAVLRMYDFIASLREYFSDNDIKTNDMHAGQLLIDPDKNLYLLDSEAYTKQK